MIDFRRPMSFAIAAVLAASCGVPELDLDGKQCPCVTGWTCDPATNTCVRDPDAAIVIDGPLIDASLPDASLPDATVACPASYIMGSNGTSWYRLVTTSATWLAAEQDCENDGPTSHLVVLDDAAERDAIVAVLTADYWIGQTDRVTEGTWTAVTGQANAFTGGATTGANNDCGRLRADNAIDSRQCTDTEDYLCECDGFAANPALYTP